MHWWPPHPSTITRTRRSAGCRSARSSNVCATTAAAVGAGEGDGDLLEEVCGGHCHGLSSDARRLRPQRLPMSRPIRGALWRSALWMAGCRHLPRLREVWRAHVVHVPLLLTQHATVDEGRWGGSGRRGGGSDPSRDKGSRSGVARRDRCRVGHSVRNDFGPMVPFGGRLPAFPWRAPRILPPVRAAPYGFVHR